MNYYGVQILRDFGCNNKYITYFEYSDCPVCLDKKCCVRTSCNHNFCIGCITKVSKCPLGRSELIILQLCKEIKNYKIIKEKEKLRQFVLAFESMLNYIDMDSNLHDSNLYDSDIGLVIDYVYLDSNERRRFNNNYHEYELNSIMLH